MIALLRRLRLLPRYRYERQWVLESGEKILYFGNRKFGPGGTEYAAIQTPDGDVRYAYQQIVQYER